MTDLWETRYMEIMYEPLGKITGWPYKLFSGNYNTLCI